MLSLSSLISQYIFVLLVQYCIFIILTDFREYCRYIALKGHGFQINLRLNLTKLNLTKCHTVCELCNSYLQNFIIKGKSSNCQPRNHHGSRVGVQNLTDDVFECLTEGRITHYLLISQRMKTECI